MRPRHRSHRPRREDLHSLHPLSLLPVSASWKCWHHYLFRPRAEAYPTIKSHALIQRRFCGSPRTERKCWCESATRCSFGPLVQRVLCHYCSFIIIVQKPTPNTGITDDLAFHSLVKISQMTVRDTVRHASLVSGRLCPPFTCRKELSNSHIFNSFYLRHESRKTQS